ncbi:MAG: hypothetical protein ABWY94_10320 [Pseudoxanthomonas sp.]
MSQPEESGTLRDYTDDLYRVYFELGESGNLAADAMKRLLISRVQGISVPSFTPASIVQKGDGYEVDIPMQIIPELVRDLAMHNVAVYQVIRVNKL